MRRGEWAGDPEALGRLGDSGVVRDAVLRRVGVSGSAIHERCRPGGPWQRLLPGIVMLGNGPASARQRTIAAMKYVGDDAVLTGRSALGEHGLAGEQYDVHVLLPANRRVQSAGFVLVERTTRIPDPLIRNGIRCAPIERALLDAARRCTTLDATRSLIASAVQRGAVSVAALQEELAEGSGRGSALPRRVLREVDANVHSVAEAKARELWERSGLPEMVFNRDVLDSRGGFIARPDGWIDDVAMAWDIDSLAWHLSPKAYKDTLERRTRMQNAGIIVLPTIPSAVERSPRRVVDDLRRHYELAASRPRPDVRLRTVTPG
ncbi:hypothetical protein QLG13_04230 [Rhodococcus aetherivorans]|uniref:hypothetical protein n=1 Tax=Rhodococcus TaxID=1827 RepID=UPI0005CA6237|nr:MULTISPECIES: hypothetical protein [Rhodococcus]MDV6295700.1 hypothetical protein [Rhodococcus aetherivorans]PND49531.1 hypothetical protein CQZ88_24790 [Rhodococcus sp. ENV425]WKW99522.1 hypothetical protein Q3O43_04165 [Rhodococcus aetherivorans]